jgi:hypothetical protein
MIGPSSLTRNSPYASESDLSTARRDQAEMPILSRDFRFWPRYGPAEELESGSNSPRGLSPQISTAMLWEVEDENARVTAGARTSTRGWRSAWTFSYSGGESKTLNFSISAQADFQGGFFVHPL